MEAPDANRRKTGNASLTEELVRFIRLGVREGRFSCAEVAKARGLGVETVRRVVRGETWAWVRDEAPPPGPVESAQSSLEKLQALLAQKAGEVKQADAMLGELAGSPPVPQEVSAAAQFLLYGKDTPE